MVQVQKELYFMWWICVDAFSIIYKRIYFDINLIFLVVFQKEQTIIMALIISFCLSIDSVINSYCNVFEYENNYSIKNISQSKNFRKTFPLWA